MKQAQSASESAVQTRKMSRGEMPCWWILVILVLIVVRFALDSSLRDPTKVVMDIIGVGIGVPRDPAAS